jgi:hypothetical protein
MQALHDVMKGCVGYGEKVLVVFDLQRQEVLAHNTNCFISQWCVPNICGKLVADRPRQIHCSI